MKTKKFASRSLILAGIFLSAGHSFAADGTAIQTGAGPFNWGDAGTWSGTIADGQDSSAFFTANITAPQVINLDAARTIGNITFTDSVSSNNDLTISGANILTLDRTTGIPVIDVTQSARTLTISSQISGSDGLQKSGAGTLFLSGTNDYTGGTVINGGKLIFASDASLGAAGAGMTLNGGTLQTDTSNSISDRILTLGTAAQNYILLNGNYSNNQQVTGAGGVTFGMAVSANRAATLSSAANDFTGALGLDVGGNVSLTLTINSLTDSIGAGNIVFSGTSTSTRTLKWNGSSALTLNNRQIELVAAGANSAIIQNDTTNAITINSNLKVTGTGARTLTLNAVAGPRNVFAGNIANSETDSSAVAITKAGAGTWALTNTANSYTGATTISTGTLEVSKLAHGESNSSIGASTNDAANLLLGNNSTLRYTGTGDSTNRGFTINVNTAGHQTTLDASGTGAINFTNTASPAYGTVDQTRTLNLTGTNTGNNTLAANIGDNGTGAVSLVKTGIGKWVLSGNNGQTGSTTLSAGTLTLDYIASNNAKFSGLLALNGGTLELSGGSAFTQSATSTTLNNGGTFIKRTNSGTNTLALGAITFTGGAVDFGAGSIATTSTANHTSGALASAAGTYRATVAGADWAKNSAGNIVAFASGDYTTFDGTNTVTADINYSSVGNVTLNANRGATTNTFKITTTGAGETMDLNTRQLSLGSMLFAGAHDYSITNTSGRIQTAFLLHNYGTNNATLTLGATNGLITQFGTGKTILAGNNAANVGINVFGGTVQFSDNLQIGTQTGVRVISLNNGTLLASDNIALDNAGANSRTVTLGAGGGTLAAAATKTLTVSGVISGTGNPLTIGTAGNTGTVTLSAINTYSGATKVNAGTLEISSTGTINSTTGVTIASGASFIYNSSTALNQGITNNGGTIGGVGTIGVAVAMDSTSDVLAPGNSPGIQPYGVSQSWAGMTYEWEVNDFIAGVAGTNYDQIAITGNLALTGAAPGSYLLDLISLTAGNVAGVVPNFSEINRTWNILTTTGTITGFNASFWTIDHSTGPNTFTSSPAWTGTWNLGLNGTNNALVLSYTAIPEPDTAALIGALGMLALLRRRR